MKFGKITLFVLAAFSLIFSLLFFLGSGGQNRQRDLCVDCHYSCLRRFHLDLLRHPHASAREFGAERDC